MDILELIFSFFLNRLGIFLFGLVLIALGIFTWLDFRKDTNLYDAAVGKDGKTVEAKITEKGRETSHNPSSNDDYVYFVRLDFNTANGLQSVKVYVEEADFAKYDQSEKIQIRYHPDNPTFVVTPNQSRESGLFAIIVSGFLVGLGAIFLVLVIISLFWK